jgi:hypothetical protein
MLLFNRYYIALLTKSKCGNEMCIDREVFNRPEEKGNGVEKNWLRHDGLSQPEEVLPLEDRHWNYNHIMVRFQILVKFIRLTGKKVT